MSHVTHVTHTQRPYHSECHARTPRPRPPPATPHLPSRTRARYVARGRCNTLQQYCNTLQHTATYRTSACELAQRVCDVGCCDVLQSVAVLLVCRREPLHAVQHCCTLEHTAAAHCQILQHTATHCNNTATHLQHAATRCNTLQHTATHCSTLLCNTLQHTWYIYDLTHPPATHCHTLQLTCYLYIYPSLPSCSRSRTHELSINA